MSDSAPTVTILGLQSPFELGSAALKIVANAGLLAGPERWLKYFPDFSGYKLPLRGPLGPWLDELKVLSAKSPAVVLAGGDPNYFGLAALIVERFGPDTVEIIPSPTTIQKAFARLKISWANVEVVSLHGRQSWRSFWSALYRASRQGARGYLALYTSPENGPNLVAKALIEREQLDWNLSIFENLGLDDENIWRGPLVQAQNYSFANLNLAILEQSTPFEPLSLGAFEHRYHHSAGLITKSEVRSVALGLLELTGEQTMWDLGCGSASVALEAAGLLDRGEVWGVEKNPERYKQALLNRRRFGAAHLGLSLGEAPQILDTLPDPDRVFIGGGGERLKEIITRSFQRLRVGGVLVCSAVLFSSLEAALSALSSLGARSSVTQVQISKSSPLGASQRLEPLDQVWLIKAKKDGPHNQGE
ncbi:MAG: precorrin-6y C5,15-methyltransferase (decarboxylating) subunit CbiE [Deltaproteobacteria bacterium]|jgi:precorrin-6Y C5,15-methyltransferase (decarboxylating)|nr:precorrin-6y C5,15-methyltransferase (decarboxylating) subunit CbiE [Deltaproteobacteria bacterium]